MQEEIVKAINLLKKPAWTYKDIMEFDNNIKSSATAIKIKNRAIKEFNGSVPFGTQYVKADSVLAIYGANRETEIKLLRELIDEKKLDQTDIQK